jgi:hypothetical protein
MIQLLNIHNKTTMLIHVFYAFVVFKVPNFYVALGERDENVSLRNRVYRRYLVPMTFIDNTEFSFLDVYEVDVHVF